LRAVLDAPKPYPQKGDDVAIMFANRVVYHQYDDDTADRECLANGNDWTYCEDALPSDVKSGYYFATRKTNSGRTYTWQTHFSQELQSWSVIGGEQVIAWQPLPVPAEPKEAK